MLLAALSVFSRWDIEKAMGKSSQKKDRKSKKEKVYCVLREAGEPPIWSRNVLQSQCFHSVKIFPLLPQAEELVREHAGSSLIKHLPHFLTSLL